MSYSNLEDCILDLEKNGHLVRVREEIDPYLEMAAVHLRIHEKGGPALLFENVKGSKYRCLSNLFGTTARSEFIFRKTLSQVKKLIEVKNNPLQAIKRPLQMISTAVSAWNALPKKVSMPSGFDEISIADLPLIQHWPMDGGAFVTLPQVYSEDPEKPGVMSSNLGMYRIQLSGNDYILNKEIGLHYQLHRGIGVHQTAAAARGEKLKVSIFVGGPPSHTFSAVMPLPESISELTFAGVLGGRRFRYSMLDGYCVSADADFVIMGEVENGVNKPEGPFGDHLGYYSLKHDFPLLKVYKVLAKKNAIWPFTVVGRPPQEDTAFGNMIHQMTGSAIQSELPGVKSVHAVDAAGVHPLLLAVGSERYTPYSTDQRPAEILTQANHILGTGQLSLAKYLFIAAQSTDTPDSHHEELFFRYIFERIDFHRDIHFQTQTSIDTLDYSGTELNSGSKVIFSATGTKKRELSADLGAVWNTNFAELSPKLVFPGVVALQVKSFSNYQNARNEVGEISNRLGRCLDHLGGFALVVLSDESYFVAENIRNFLWVTFTRSNPSHDIYGVNEKQVFKHWSCHGPLIIDARIKPHHAPVLVKDESTEEKINRFFKPGSSLSAFA